MHALGSIALLLLTSTAVSAQRPPTESLLGFADAAFTVGYRSYSAAFFRSMISIPLTILAETTDAVCVFLDASTRMSRSIP